MKIKIRNINTKFWYFQIKIILKMTLTSMVKFGSKPKLTEANLIFTMQELVKPHGHAQKKKKVNKENQLPFKKKIHFLCETVVTK